MPSRIPLVLGTAPIGAPGTMITKFSTLEESQKFIDRFTDAGYDQLDTSQLYGNGTTEEYIGKLNLHGAKVDTKAFPISPGDHAPETLRATFQKSLKALSPHQINIFYLHAPDRSVPFEDTLREVDRIHKEGHFKEFGLSNFNSWEVAEVVGICKANNWVRPTVYQGKYNALERNVEIELIPCLRKFGIRFFAYSPLAAGLLTGSILTEADMTNKKGGRFDTEAVGHYAYIMQERYKGLVPASAELEEASGKYNLHVTEVAQRWLQHHSNLDPNDRVIIGASSLGQLDINLRETLGGPLPDEVLQAVNNVQGNFKGKAAHYAI